MNSNFDKWLKGYRATALVVFNTIILLVAVSALLGYLYHKKNETRPLGSMSRGITTEQLGTVYPDYGEQQIKNILHETWFEYQQSYAPYRQRAEVKRSGTYVNVTKAGYRSNGDQQIWQPPEDAISVFIFGGSTTFGYGVEDAHTIPTYLEKFLDEKIDADVVIYNFGNGAYASVQERLYFEELLWNDVKPDVAIFIDGLNEFVPGFGLVREEESQATEVLKEFVRIESSGGSLAQFSFYAKGFIRHSPLLRLVNTLSVRLAGANILHTQAEGEQGPFEDEEIENTALRYIHNQQALQALADRFGTELLFVWQPVPQYKHNIEGNIFFVDPIPEQDTILRGYQYMANLKNDGVFRGVPFLWLADIQEDIKEPIYVDGVHYTAAFNKDIAQRIGGTLITKGIVNK